MMSRFIFYLYSPLIKEAEDWYLNPPVNFWQDFSQKLRQIHDILNRASTEEDDFQRLNTSEDEVRRAFQIVNPNKATGPGNTAPRVLKACESQHSHCSVVRAPDSWLKGRGFESLLERRENFLLQGPLSVLTLISVSDPPPCYHSSTYKIPVILPKVQVAGYS